MKYEDLVLNLKYTEILDYRKKTIAAVEMMTVTSGLKSWGSAPGSDLH